jgi:hypothetical protein
MAHAPRAAVSVSAPAARVAAFAGVPLASTGAPGENGEAVALPLQRLRVPLPAAAGGARLELDITDRAGQLDVKVKAADPAVAAEVRRQVNDLVRGLDDAGFQAEVLHPAGVARASDPSAQGNPSGQPGESGRDTPGAGAQGDGRRRQHAQNNWLELLDRIAGWEEPEIAQR